MEEYRGACRAVCSEDEERTETEPYACVCTGLLSRDDDGNCACLGPDYETLASSGECVSVCGAGAVRDDVSEECRQEICSDKQFATLTLPNGACISPADCTADNDLQAVDHFCDCVSESWVEKKDIESAGHSATDFINNYYG